MMLPIRSLLNWFSPAGPGGRLNVLIFHRVLSAPDAIFPDEVDAQRFDLICGWLKSWFNVLPLDEAAQALRYERLPERACCITFDDGYADNLHVAVPILKKHGLTATFFIATGFLDGGRMWNDTVIDAVRRCPVEHLDLGEFGSYELRDATARRDAIHALLGQIKYRPPAERVALTERIAVQAGVEADRHLMMTSDELRRMRAAGMLIGAHTVNHPILARLDPDTARQEMRESQQFLQELLKERIGLFAYPNGRPGADYLPEHVQLVRELGFDAAVSTAWGAGNVGTDSFQIPRFSPWDRSRERYGLRLVKNLWAKPPTAG